MFNKINSELQIIADEKRQEIIDVQYEDELSFLELERQYEAMQNAAELENFSPFDTVNS
jgi:hypothetical protein